MVLKVVYIVIICVYFPFLTFKMTSIRCFLKKPPLPWIQIPILVITLSILLSSYGGIWLKTCILLIFLLSAFMFTFLSKLDSRNINEDVNLSNELEMELFCPESHLHKDDNSDVSGLSLDLCVSSCRGDANIVPILSDVPEGTKKIVSGRLENENDENVVDISYSESESNDISFSSSSPDFSDGSISDEESLIELEIPSGIYVASPAQTHKGKQEEDQEFINKLSNFHQFKDPMFDFFDIETRKMFKQQNILDLLAEFNEMNMEEENLIEIDIAMGSIKCPRFEIKA